MKKTPAEWPFCHTPAQLFPLAQNAERPRERLGAGRFLAIINGVPTLLQSSLQLNNNSFLASSVLRPHRASFHCSKMLEVNSSNAKEESELSEKYENPLDKPETAYINSFALLKERIKHHYEICSEYYLNLW